MWWRLQRGVTGPRHGRFWRPSPTTGRAFLRAAHWLWTRAAGKPAYREANEVAEASGKEPSKGKKPRPARAALAGCSGGRFSAPHRPGLAVQVAAAVSPDMGATCSAGCCGSGQDVTLFTGEEPAGQHALLDADANAGGGRLAVEHEASWWAWDRWYSRHPMATFASSFVARAGVHRRLVRRLVAAHRERPFDVVVQFSQFELLSMGKRMGMLPPVVLLPCRENIPRRGAWGADRCVR